MGAEAGVLYGGDSPPPSEQTDRQTHTTENITFATPLTDGNDVDNDPRLRSIHSEGNQP